MQLFIFIVGLFVSMSLIYGLFALVPGEIRPPERSAGVGNKDDNG